MNQQAKRECATVEAACDRASAGSESFNVNGGSLAWLRDLDQAFDDLERDPLTDEDIQRYAFLPGES